MRAFPYRPYAIDLVKLEGAWDGQAKGKGGGGRFRDWTKYILYWLITFKWQHDINLKLPLNDNMI